MTLKQVLKNPMKYLPLTLMMLLMLTGCGLLYDEDACPVTDTQSVSLSFSLYSTGPILYSRDDAQEHDEVSSEFRYFEDGIDVNDLAVFVFAKITGSDEQERLVYKLTDLTKSDDARINIVGTAGNYYVEVMIFRDDLKEVLGGYEITPGGNENISFRMLMLANCSSPGTDATAKWNQITGTDYPTVIAQLNGWNYAMSYIYNPDGGDDVTTLYKNSKEHVPMFGNIMFDPVSEDALYYSRPENRVYLGEMNLLRALAKVRVVDNIADKDAGGYPKISSVEFLSSQSEAHQLPYDALNYVNGNQIHTPYISFPDNVLNENNPVATYRLGILPEAWTIIPASERKGNVFIGFVPEQKNTDDVHPILRIWITDKKYDGTDETYVYNVPMTKYNGTQFEFGDNILRNHIYTLSVNKFGTDLFFKVDLTPYTGVYLEPSFGF